MRYGKIHGSDNENRGQQHEVSAEDGGKKREKAGPISHMRDTGGRESEDFFKTEEEWDRKRRS